MDTTKDQKAPAGGWTTPRERFARQISGESVGRYRFWIEGAADAGAWFGALALAAVLVRDLSLVGVPWRAVLTLAVVATVVQVALGTLAGLYIGRWRVGSFDEMKALVGTVLVTVTATLVVDLSAGTRLVVGAVIGGGFVALVVTAATRSVYRLIQATPPAPGGSRQRLLIFGAGAAGYRIVRALQSDPAGAYLPVALLDDDERKAKRRVHGVPVVGTRAQLGEACVRHRADALLIAIPSAGPGLIGELTELGQALGLSVKTLPSLAQLLGTPAALTDIRDVTEEDLLGRRLIDTDLDAIAHYITGKRVLVTGAGGSIGSELCRQLYCFAPSELIMVDRDESALHAVQMSIEGRALLDSDNLVLLDIRDRTSLTRLFQRRRPEVVFHAAALKHLPLLERHPLEAVKTNVWGTLALLETSAATGVERFVNISTDKAADPVSVLGYSKRICERLTAHFAEETGSPYLSVRFGNVLGSRGSVLGAFRAQIEHGGPITVTHPDVTRYFMTVQEAVQLVIQAGAIGRGGEALVLDMGEPVQIQQVARMLASRAPRPIEIVYTGLRPGEKLHEDLLGDDEEGERPFHPLISHVPVPGLDPPCVQCFSGSQPNAEIIGGLRDLSGQQTASRHAG
jgi:FlaA1/EpsC-like NDP-sugar epimerase